MRYLLLLLPLFVLFTSCNRTTIEKENYADGKVRSEKTFKKIDGEKQLIKEVVYHPNGKKYIEGGFKAEKREGYWASWFENGNLWSEGEFKNGESHGKRTVYHQNGKIYYEGNYDMGKRTGIWKYYDENGKLLNETDYSKVPDDKK